MKITVKSVRDNDSIDMHCLYCNSYVYFDNGWLLLPDSNQALHAECLQQSGDIQDDQIELIFRDSDIE